MGSLDSNDPLAPDVTLRKFTREDAAVILTWGGDDEVTVTTPNDTLRSEAEALHYFDATIAPHPWYRAICVDGVAAGAVYVTPGPGIHAVRGELSYILAKEYWGRGVMTRAVRMAVHAAFWELRLARVQAFALDTNIGSQRVLEKCGFAREGLLRNFVKLRGTLRHGYVFAVWQTPGEK